MFPGSLWPYISEPGSKINFFKQALTGDWIFFQSPYAKIWSPKNVNKIFPLQWNTNRWKTLVTRIRMKRTRLGPQWRFFQWIRLNTNPLINNFPLPLKNQVEQIECWPFTQFHATSNCFNSTWCLVLCQTEKLPFGSLFYV